MKGKVFIETYGCQMNISDSGVALAVLEKAGFAACTSIGEADVILVNTCSVRENAEKRVFGRLNVFLQEKKKRKGIVVGVLGCMAQRMKEELLENEAVDFVAGPDSYRMLPSIIEEKRACSTALSSEETYADIDPARIESNGVTAFISIARGCDNLCSYCIVPFTRGRERSRDPKTIVKEAEDLFNRGYKEVTLLGQNVDSYNYTDPDNPTHAVNFYQLLELVALVSPQLRVRFQTSHPKDIRKGVLYTMAMYPNICNHIHLPVQSGSNEVLKRMNRRYTREEYLQKIAAIREILPDCSITTDVIAGFCGETDEDFRQTLSLMEKAEFDSAFMFEYSQRPGTLAARNYKDDVPQEVKTARLNEIIEKQNVRALASNQKDIGQTYEVLVEGVSKRSDLQLTGRTQQNKMCVFDAAGAKPGDYVNVRIEKCTSATLIGQIVKEPDRKPFTDAVYDEIKETFKELREKFENEFLKDKKD